MLGALVLTTAILTVGLTASSESAFSIRFRPVFLRLGLDIDVRIGSAHLHTRWTVLPETPEIDSSTKTAPSRF